MISILLLGGFLRIPKALFYPFPRGGVKRGMMRLPKVFKSGDPWAILFLIAWPLIYFFPVTLGQGVWFTRDISRLYYPFVLEYAHALTEGRLPLWTTSIQSGFPLLAEGHVAAFYPTRAFLLRLMPPHFVISYEMLFHLIWAGCGMYLCAHAMGFRVSSAMLAGFIASFNGFMIQKIYHTPILITVSWLPWLIFFLHQFQRAQRDHTSGTKWFLFATLASGIQWLEGFPQIALVNSIAVGFVGLFGGLFWNRRGDARPERFNAIARVTLWTALPILLGMGIAAIQLVPTIELIGYSTRVGSTIDLGFRTSYSLPPEFLIQFVMPFSPGEPSDDNNEYWGYVGLTTLVLAVSAPFLRRDARTYFFAMFAVSALSLTLGALNPAYQVLTALPIFSFFRVPARFLLLFVFAVTFLATTGFEELTQRIAAGSRRWPTVIAMLFALLVVSTIKLAYDQSLEFWLSAWQVLPWLLVALSVGVIALALTRRVDRGTFSAAMIGLTVFDLAAYAPPFLKTIDALSPPSYVTQVPHSVPALGPAQTLERIYTDESLWPSVPSIRSSLLPNFGILYGKESAHAYSPLVSAAYEAYFFFISPAMLNLLNVRYVMVPLEPRPADRAPSPYPVLRLDVVDNQAVIPPTPASSILVASFTEDATERGEGFVAAELVVGLDNGESKTFPLRVGIETADWDYGRKAGTFEPPRQARVAHSVPAFWRALGRTFEGYVYQARVDIAPPGESRNVVAVKVVPKIPRSRLTIERVSLLNGNTSTSLAALTGKNDFMLKYFSDTTAAWENLNMLPRAFLVHRAETMSDDDVFDKLHEIGFRPDLVALLHEGQPLSASNRSAESDVAEITSYKAEQVSISVTTDRAGYLVLADAWYPGWNVWVDDRPAPLYRADAIFRAVPVEAGHHLVRFEYRSMPLMLGAAISAASLLLAIGIAFAIYRRSFPPNRAV